MSAFDSLHGAQEQICYVNCCFCNTILLVSVPYSSLTMVVTIICGHCNDIFSLNMTKLFSLLDHHQMPKLEVSAEKVAEEEDGDEEKNQDYVWCNQVNNKRYSAAPEKKQRAPNAYNQFIRDEIKRLKIENPNITHKQAFSAAAKNWAHCPQNEYKEEEIHGCDEGERNMALDDEVHFLGNAFHEIKALRQSSSCNSLSFY